MHETRRSVLLGAGAALAAAPIALAAETPAPTPHLASPLLGEPNAPKRFVVWGSCTCPYTALLYSVLFGIVKDPEFTNLVNVEWRHFPTHPPDPALHVAALGFEGEQFWGFVSSVLGVVYQAGGSYNALTPDKLVELAIAQGGSKETLEAAYADKAKWNAVKEDLMAGQLLGVTRTPGLFYNGYFMTAQGIPSDTAAFDKSLREMLKTG